jgi:hypothetical protein
MLPAAARAQFDRSDQTCDALEPPKPPSNSVGQPRSITPPMLSALLNRLIEKPDMYQDEMAVFLFDEFDVLVTTQSISRERGPATCLPGTLWGGRD